MTTGVMVIQMVLSVKNGGLIDSVIDCWIFQCGFCYGCCVSLQSFLYRLSTSKINSKRPENNIQYNILHKITGNKKGGKKEGKNAEEKSVEEEAIEDGEEEGLP